MKKTTGNKSPPCARFVTTRAVSVWDGTRYVEIECEGYWYAGPWALVKDVDAVYECEDFRWRNDDGSITTATWIKAENTAVVSGDGIEPGDNVRLRVNFAETAGAQGTGQDTGSFTLQWRKDAGTWTTLTGTGDCKTFDSTNLTNGTAIATGNHVLTQSWSTTAQAWGDENEDGVTPSQTWRSDHAEAEFSIQFDGTGNTGGEVYTFRMLGPDASVVTFTNVPTLTLATPAAGNTSELPKGTLPLAGIVPTAFASDFQQSNLPKGTLNLTGIVPTAFASDFQQSNLPKGTLNLAGIVPEAVTSDNNFADLPVGALPMAGIVPTVFASDSNTVTLPVGSLPLAGIAPTVTQYPAVWINDVASKNGGEVLQVMDLPPDFTPTDTNLRIDVDIGALTPGTLYLGVERSDGEIAWRQITVTSAGETVQLPKGVLAWAGIVPQAVTTEKNFADLPAGTLPLAGIVPQAVTTEHNYSDLPVGALPLAGIAPQATATEGDTVTLPAGTLPLAGIAPQATTTENRFVDLPVGSLPLAGIAPQAATTEKHFVGLPKGAMDLVGIAPTADSTEGDNVTLPTGALPLAGIAPQATTTENRTSILPAGALNLIGIAPTVSTTEKNFIELPKGALDLTGIAPEAFTTEGEAVELPTGSLPYAGIAPQAVTTENNVAALPVGSLPLTGLAPTIVTSELNVVTLPKSTLDLTGIAPTIVTTEGDTVQLPLGTLPLVGIVPQFVTTEGEIVELPVGTLPLIGIAPTVLTPTVAHVRQQIMEGLGSIVDELANLNSASRHRSTRYGASLMPGVNIYWESDAPIYDLGTMGCEPLHELVAHIELYSKAADPHTDLEDIAAQFDVAVFAATMQNVQVQRGPASLSIDGEGADALLLLDLSYSFFYRTVEGAPDVPSVTLAPVLPLAAGGTHVREQLLAGVETVLGTVAGVTTASRHRSVNYGAALLPAANTYWEADTPDYEFGRMGCVPRHELLTHIELFDTVPDPHTNLETLASRVDVALFTLGNAVYSVGANIDIVRNDVTETLEGDGADALRLLDTTYSIFYRTAEGTPSVAV